MAVLANSTAVSPLLSSKQPDSSEQKPEPGTRTNEGLAKKKALAEMRGTLRQLEALHKRRSQMGVLCRMAGARAALDREIKETEKFFDEQLAALKAGKTVSTEQLRAFADTLTSNIDGYRRAEARLSRAFSAAQFTKDASVATGSAVALAIGGPTAGAAYRMGVSTLCNAAENTTAVIIGESNCSKSIRRGAGRLAADAAASGTLLAAGLAGQTASRLVLSGPPRSVMQAFVANQAGAAVRTTVFNACEALPKLLTGTHLKKQDYLHYSLNYLSGGAAAGLGLHNSIVQQNGPSLAQSVGAHLFDTLGVAALTAGQAFLERGKLTRDDYVSIFAQTAAQYALAYNQHAAFVAEKKKMQGMLNSLADEREQGKLLPKIKEFLAAFGKQEGVTEKEAAQLADALALMNELHSGQKRVDGNPYTAHTLLVTLIMTGKFGLTNGAAPKGPENRTRLVDLLCAACLHDAVEDQSARILARNGIRSSGNNEQDKSLALQLLGNHFTDKHEAGQMRRILSALTNPGFGSMISDLTERPTSATANEANKLLENVKRVLPEDGTDFSKLISRAGTGDQAAVRELKNKLYLGHFIQIRDNHPDAFLVKLADFVSNALHLHLLQRSYADLSPDDPARPPLQKKLETLPLKYEPVLRYLERIFSADGEVIGTDKGDRWYQVKLSFARQHGYKRP